MTGLSGILVSGPAIAQGPLAEATSTKFPVAGRSYDEADDIYTRNKGPLGRLPGVQGSALEPDGIVVYTDNPAALPAEIAGIPVMTGPPIYPRIAGRSFREVEAVLSRHRRSLEQLPDMESVAVRVDGIVVHTANPDVLPLSIEGTPIHSRRSWGRPIDGISYVEVLAIYER